MKTVTIQKGDMGLERETNEQVHDESLDKAKR